MKFVREGEAEGRTAEIFEEMKAALGLPHVSMLFEAYGVYPKFLELHWGMLQPLLQGGSFFRLADRLRAEASTRVENYLDVPDLSSSLAQSEVSDEAGEEVSRAVEVFDYENALLLLIAAAQMQAFEENTFTGNTGGTPPVHPEFTHEIELTDELAMSPAVRKLFEEVKASTDASFVSLEYRALARWPEFLACYWRSLKPVMASPFYSDHKRRMREAALALALELPARTHLTVAEMQEAGISDEEISQLTRTTELFLDVLSGAVLNVAFAKVGLEGGARGHAEKKPLEISRQPRRNVAQNQ